MIWIITTAILYALTAGIALFLICSGDKARGKDAYWDLRNIVVAILWPAILGGHGIWMVGKRIFKEKSKTEDNGTVD